MGVFRKYRAYISGVVTGALIMAAVPVMANNELVSAMIDESITLIIANEYKHLPSDYSILNYKGYTYLPSRYVAEQLGATVSWDDATRTISITEPPAKEVEKIVEVEKTVEVPVEKIVYVERDESYQRLPATQEKEGTILRVNSMSRRGPNATGATDNVLSIRNNTMSVAVDFDNRFGAYDIVVDYAAVTLVVDGITYKTTDVTGSAWDQTLMNGSVLPGRTYSGFFIFPAADSGTKNYVLTVPARFGNMMTTFMIKYTATTYGD